MTPEERLDLVGVKLAVQIHKYRTLTLSLYEEMNRAASVEAREASGRKRLEAERKKEQLKEKWIEAKAKYEVLRELYRENVTYEVFKACQAKLEELEAH